MVDTEELELLVDILEWDSLSVAVITIGVALSHIPSPSALDWWVRSQT